ncbi:MAG: tetratricopeptide repeat protein [Gemmatimonadaceae bacterium]|nr:tetratricopeptide repeat protein [Gemmatimonadaceae bacterium]
MANSALIEDLRKQFAENPRRVFARLANEYRKSGDLDVAIEICRAHVPLQPTYISGYIVLGQALFERGQPEEARSTFETALSLDPENLIALRQLGDIARASGDLEAARGWYHKLLEVDPQNDDIAAQLEALNVPSQAAAAPTTAGATRSPTPAEASPVSWSDIHPDSEVTPLSKQATQPTRPRFTIGVIPENLTVGTESAPRETPAPAAAAIEESPAVEALVDQHSVSSVLPEYVGGFDRHSPTPPAASPIVPEPVAQDAPEAEAAAPAEMVNIEELAPSETEELHADLPPLRTTSEHTVAPATAAELAALFAEPDLEPTSLAESVGSKDDAPTKATDDHGPTFDEEPYDPTIGRMLELTRRTSTDALLPDLMMTESGAELLREQGHIDQAIYVYRHLAAKNPEDTSYAERIAALERGAHSSIPLIADISQDIIIAAKNRSYSTQSIRTFFTSFATRRPPEGVSEESPESSDAPAAPKAVVLEAAVPEAAVPEAVVPEAASSGVTAAVTEAPVAHEPRASASWHTPEAASAPAASMEPWSAASLEHTTSFAVPPEALPMRAAEPTPAAPDSVSDADRSALETLFSGSSKAVAPNDERAANSLASAFSEEFSTESTAPAGQPTRAASDALSLDAVFQNSRTRADGEQRASQPTVSFDQFFNSRDNGINADGKSAAAVETASLSDDSQSDLELFHEWLDGLKK